MPPTCVCTGNRTLNIVYYFIAYLYLFKFYFHCLLVPILLAEKLVVDWKENLFLHVSVEIVTFNSEENIK